MIRSLSRIKSSFRTLKRSVPSAIEVYPDGFVPAAQFGTTGNMQTVYESSATAFSCISVNSIAAATIGAQVQELQGPNKWVRIEHDELDEFLMAPSGTLADGRPAAPPHWSWDQLMFLQLSNLYIYGNAYLVPKIVRGGKRLYSVAPLLSGGVEVKTNSRTGYPSSYRTATESYRPEEIVHTTMPSPFSLSVGFAPIQAALRAINIDYATGERIKWHLENKIAPGLVFTQEGFPGLTTPQRDEFLAYLWEEFRLATKDGSPLVIGDGMTVASSPDTGHQTEYEHIRTPSQAEVRAVFGTPPPVVGIYDNATLNNFGEAFKIWWRAYLFPILRQYYTALNVQLIQPIYGRAFRIWYDDRGSEIATLIRNERADLAQKFVNMGYPPNIASDEAGLGMPHVPELDVPLMNVTVAGRDTPPATEEE